MKKIMNMSYNGGVFSLNKVRKIRCFSFFVISLMASIFAGPAYGQQEVTVSGRVTDENSDPLPGATIAVEGAETGTTSDIDGTYVINIAEDAVLVFSFVGYETQRIPVEGRSTIDVRMEMATGALDEVVVVGYGELSRKKVTTSIARYDTEEIDNIALNTIGDGLKGKLSGVRVYSLSGQPGDAPQIRIRGGSSIQKSNAPLVLVDGFERSMADVNPKDIESVDVLKDAAATAIYGSRGSNGVVLITTKRGSYNTSPQITFESNLTHQNIERYYERVNAEQFLNLSRPALARSPNSHWLTSSGFAASTNNDENSFIGLRYLDSGETPPEGWQTMPDPLDPSRTLVFVDNDWADIMFNPALRQNYYLNASGGSENIRYSGGIGYTDDRGVLENTGWSSFTGRVNTDITVSDNLTLSTNLDFIETHPEQHASQNNGITRQLQGPPTQRKYMDDGTPARGYNSTSTAPLFWNYIHYRDQVSRRYNIGANLDYNIFNNLVLSASGKHYISNNQFDGFERANVFNSLRPARSTFNESVRNQYEGLINYEVLGKSHNFSFLGGASFLSVRNKGLSAEAQGAATDKVMTLNVAPEKTDASSTISEEVLVGYFGRVSYDYQQKYLFSISARMDGSSRFGEGNKWSFFPSFSAAWNISDEEFLQNNQIISNLKLRGSVGQTGNNDIGLYTAQGSYSLGWVYDENAGVRNSIMPNRDLRWEETTQWDIGVDVGLFEDRINLRADLYDKRTRDLLFSVPLPNTSGFSSIESNIGTVRFYGYDIELAASVIQTRDFGWDVNFNISGNKNEVLKLPDNGRENNRIGGWVVPDGEDFGGIAEGEPLYRLWGFKVDYIIDNEEQAQNARWDYWAQGWDSETETFELGRKFPGDYEWVDRNGDGEITEIDQFEMGRTVPHTVGGIGNDFSFKNFTLRIFMDYAIGHTKRDGNFGFSMMSTFNNSVAMPVQILDAWKEPGDAANTKYARFAPHDTNESRNYRRPSNVWHFDAGYLAIREVSLNYQLPSSLTQKWGIKNMNVYMSGHNLHYFTEVLASHPNAASDEFGGNSGYPPIRKITIGIKTEF